MTPFLLFCVLSRLRAFICYLTAAVWILSKCPLVQINWSKAICCVALYNNIDVTNSFFSSLFNGARLGLIAGENPVAAGCYYVVDGHHFTVYWLFHDVPFLVWNRNLIGGGHHPHSLCIREEAMT